MGAEKGSLHSDLFPRVYWSSLQPTQDSSQFEPWANSQHATKCNDISHCMSTIVALFNSLPYFQVLKNVGQRGEREESFSCTG